MATVADSEERSGLSPGEKPPNKESETLEVPAWMEYAVHQARIIQKTVEDTVDATIQASRSRLLEIRSTSSAHAHQTLDALQDIKSDFNAYEDMFFGKIKEGLLVAASHPTATFGITAGLGLFILKRPRRFLYHSTLRIFLSEESLLSRADTKVKELRQSIDLLKAESEKLEKRTLRGEEEFKRGRTKLRQAGNQIQSVISSSYKIERQARGLKDILGDLPGREASRFRSQVSNLASEAKQERNALTKEVSKISNHGISI